MMSQFRSFLAAKCKRLQMAWTAHKFGLPEENLDPNQEFLVPEFSSWQFSQTEHRRAFPFDSTLFAITFSTSNRTFKNQFHVTCRHKPNFKNILIDFQLPDNKPLLGRKKYLTLCCGKGGEVVMNWWCWGSIPESARQAGDFLKWSTLVLCLHLPLKYTFQRIIPYFF